MTIGGWTMLIITVGFFTALNFWCIRKVLATPDVEEHIHDVIHEKTPDMNE